jgi:primary-amine oxidase
MDPSFAWYQRNFLDAGEFNAGGLLKPLLAGLDCPEHAVYLDGLVAGEQGRPKPVSNVLCLFERETGDMAWRHFAEEPESRRRRNLVVRSAAVLGNYDYVFDWTFQQDGSIRIAVGASGIAEVKATSAATPSDQASDSGDSRDAVETAECLRAFRRQAHGRRQPLDMARPALWRVLSATARNHVDYPTSYQLVPGMSVSTLLTPDDYPRRRAGFIDHHLWVTPYRLEERYAAGDYPTLSTPGQGLPAWTEANRRIEQTDIVLWHTIGMHHVVRAEDWPVMPVVWHSFELRPFDFFDRNPALDLPRR